MVALSGKLIAEIRSHAEESFPHECCGAVIEQSSGDSVRRITNVQDRLHGQDPVNYPRTAANAYHMEERQLFDLLREIEENGWRLKAFYHSHPSHDAYFSAEDTRRAIFWGEPAYPGTHYIVVSVFEAKTKDIKAYGWDERKLGFVEQRLDFLD